MQNTGTLYAAAAEFTRVIAELRNADARISELVRKYAPEKSFKGHQHVGALGEIYAKLLLGGTLQPETGACDLITQDERHVSVKTRKGWKAGWSQSSAIPSIEDNALTHLVFVHLNDDYSLRKAWLFPWQELKRENRLKSHIVAGLHRSFVFSVRESSDRGHEIFPAPGDKGMIAADDSEAVTVPHTLTAVLEELRAARGAMEEPVVHWSSNAMWTDAMERFHAANTGGRTRVALDVDNLMSKVTDSGQLPFDLLFAMVSVYQHEGMEGFRGAPRLVAAFVQLLSEIRDETGTTNAG